MKSLKIYKIASVVAICTTLFTSTKVVAAGEALPPPNANFSFNSILGTIDKQAARRGFQVYKEVCSACHGMKQLSYRNLLDIGLTEDQVREIAATFTVTDGPNDEGQMFERPARIADKFRRPFPNEQAARVANNGAYPPDLSVITKARKDGANYVHALLTGYVDPLLELLLATG